MLKERMPKSKDQMRMGFSLQYADTITALAHGEFFGKMTDGRTGEVLVEWHRPNVITLDAGILLASLSAGSAVNPSGLTALAVGTGATGPILTPDAPTNIQRSLNTEIARKAFSSKQYRNSSGVAVAFRTNIVDFTATFSEAEAVGALNEMAVVSPFIPGGAPSPIPTLPVYDPTVDVTGKDLIGNYSTFGCISKPATAVLTLTWRLTF